MKRISRYVEAVMRPVKAEPVFFMLVFLMMLQQPIEWLCIISDNSLSYVITRFLQGLAIEAGVAYCATALVAKAGKWLKWTLYAFFWFLMATTFFLEINFEQNISQQTLTVLVETNPKESSEFVDTYMWTSGSKLTYLADAAVLLLIAVCERFRRPIGRGLARVFRKRMWHGLLSAAVTVGTAMMAVCYVALALCGNSQTLYSWRDQYPHDSLDPFSQSLHAINSLRAFSNDVDYALETAREVYDTPATVDESDSLTVVYVLGESYNKHHAHIYGYTLPTTPNLEREQASGNLFVFHDAVAQVNYTSVVMKNTFSINCVGNGEHWFRKPNFTTVFRRAGYDVWMWDMQRNYMAKRLFTITVNSYIYNPELAKLSYTACNDKAPAFDGMLIDDFTAKAKFTSKHNLVVFHLMGQHVSFAKRYPRKSKFNKFRAKDIKRNDKYLDSKKKYAIATYDNATLYNDSVMEQIFTVFRHKNAVVVYLSDHGEEIYDYRDVRGRYMAHDPEPNALRHQNEVPFMIWCSNKFKARYPATVAQIRSAVRRPLMTDVVGHLLLNLGRVRTPYYEASHDVISPAYKPAKRLLYDHADYDQIMKKAKN